ncbi:hypothetical protein [Rheinheimera aquimaris]|uniref:hypothetical protein n=1 Tax=Rheinheimera aquimaris TaxID=412437 RepID=UPI001E33CE9D|nr:hypothetical protein [Rheinheimera aquimaris]MCD1597892.1 hypothetical protein [Rheinheimera aquimaris]
MSAVTALPTEEQIRFEIAVATSLEEQYGTNQPTKTYEHGVVDALLWVLGGQKPCTVEETKMDLNKNEQDVLKQWVAGEVKAQKVYDHWREVPLLDDEYDNELLMQICRESPTFANLVRSSLHYLDTSEDNHIPTWLGSYQTDRPKTQVQLVVTQHPNHTIDED